MIWLILIFIELYYCIVLRALVCSYACQVPIFPLFWKFFFGICFLEIVTCKNAYIKKIIKICL